MIYLQTYEYLYIIPVWILFWYIFFREKIGYTLPNHLFKKYISNSLSIYILWFFRLCIIACFSLWIAGPYMIGREVVVKNSPGKIAIILDISRSMLAEDISPNRIQTAKNTIHTFLTHAKWKEISLIIFAGKPYIVSPFTTDLTWLENLIKRIQTDTILQEKSELSGTAIGDALLLWATSFWTWTSEKSILLITDGRANVGIDPANALDLLKKDGIRVTTLWIWWEVWWELSYTMNGQKVYFYDPSGNKLSNDIDESLLKKIAQETGGKYIRAKSTISLENEFTDILPKIIWETQKTIEERRIALDIFFFLWGGLCMIFERLWRRSLWKKYGLLKK